MTASWWRDVSVAPVVAGFVVVLVDLAAITEATTAAITAAICMRPEAQADPAKRNTAPAMAGIFHTLLGLAGGAVVALRGSIAGGLAQALAEPRHRDAAAMTFLVTLSGSSGAVFWGVVAGSVTRAVQNLRD